MSKKVFKLVSMLVLLVPILVGFTGTKVSAAEETEKVSVNIHKRVFESGQKPADKLNTGEIMADFGGKPLNDVTFEAYEVTNKYLELLETMTADETTQTIISDAKQAHYAPAYAKVVGTQKTVEDGTATFANLPIKIGNKYATYLFVETNSPRDIKEKAAPIVITMPLYKDGNQSNEINHNVHVYPKNEKEKMITKGLSDDSKKALAVTINGQTIYNVEKGQEFSYGISTLIPWNIADKDFYRVTDTPNEGMVVLKESITIEGLTHGTDYVIYTDKSGRGYAVHFNTESRNVKALAGKRISISYKAKLTEDVKMDIGINNEAYVEIGTITNPDEKPKWPETPTDPTYPTEPEKPTTETPDKPTDPEEPGTPEKPVTGEEVFTGGKKFIKVDDKSGKNLADAKFNLVKIDATGKIITYASYNEGKYTWNEEQIGSAVYTSNDKGSFNVTGLEYSEKLPKGISYAVKEIEAPTGYALLEAPVTFNVTKGEYEATELPITNIKKGLLPSTGGNGIYMFIVAGSVLMVGALVWYRRTQVETNI